MDSDLLTDVAFMPGVVITATKLGHVKLWVRPLNLTKTAAKGEHKVDT